MDDIEIIRALDRLRARTRDHGLIDLCDAISDRLLAKPVTVARPPPQTRAQIQRRYRQRKKAARAA